MGYHTESRCQYEPASISSAFKLSGAACLVGMWVGVVGCGYGLGVGVGGGGGGGGGGVPSQIGDM